MSTSRSGSTYANPRALALFVGIGFIVLVGLLSAGAALLVNTFQGVRQDQAANEARARGEELPAAELERRYPTIDLF